MKKIIDRVTITGADTNTKHEDLFKLSEDFPFVEWGILLSKSGEGKARFPTYAWMLKLSHMFDEYIKDYKAFQLSGHICGKWVRDICQGNWVILDDCSDVYDIFARFQLNFHAQVHTLKQSLFLKGFDDPRLYLRQFIFQLDNVNNDILNVATQNDVDAVPLFDLSGGAGILPEEWPKANGYCGYAGGLSPDNLESQLKLIEQVSGDGPIWIDVETRVRTDDDSELDLGKVRAFLEVARPWVTKMAALV